MKRLVLLLLALAASFTLLTACGNDTPDPQTPETPAITDASETPEATETEAELPADGLAVVANGEAKFILIRPEQATKAELSLMTSLRKYIEEKTGATLEVKDDWIKKGQEHDASAFEILIGNTNYNETKAVKDTCDSLEVVVSAQGNKIVLFSALDDGYVTLTENLDAIFSEYVSGSSLVLPKDFSFQDKHVLRLSGLPAYTGKAAKVEFIDSGYDNHLQYILGASKNDYLAYRTELEAAGFTLHAEHEAANNLFATYYDKDQMVTVYFLNKTRTLRIVEEPLSVLPPRAEDVGSYEKVCEPAIRLVGQEFYAIPDGNDTGLEAIPNALCFIFRLSDGRLIVVDSGYHASYDGEPDYLIRNLKEMSPDPNHVTIAAWIFTHAHSDHAGGFWDLATDGVLSKGIIQVEHIIFNFETTKEYTYGGELEMGKNFAKLSFKNTDTKLITAHTGQIYHYADATVEMLYTPEDYHPKTFDEHNTTSLAFRITLAGQTFMMLGDISPSGSPVLADNFGSYLQSDFVQIAHHGYPGGSKALYQAINAKIALWPTGNTGFQTQYVKSPHKTAMDLATDVFVAGFAQQTITLPYTPVGNKQAAIDQALADRAIIAKENMERQLNGGK